MSWSAYITNCLINTADENGHLYNDVLVGAAIVGHNGVEWAKSGVNVSIYEAKKLVELFKSKPGTFPSVILDKKEYQITHYEPDNVVYLKIKDGGAIVAKTYKAFIIGIYDTTKKYKFDGKALPQNEEVCNFVVEDLATKFKNLGY